MSVSTSFGTPGGAQDLGVQEMVVHRDVQECAGSVLSGVPSIVYPNWCFANQTFIFGGFLRVLPAHFTARSRMRRGDWGILANFDLWSAFCW